MDIWLDSTGVRTKWQGEIDLKLYSHKAILSPFPKLNDWDFRVVVSRLAVSLRDGLHKSPSVDRVLKQDKAPNSVDLSRWITDCSQFSGVYYSTVNAVMTDAGC